MRKSENPKEIRKYLNKQGAVELASFILEMDALNWLIQAQNPGQLGIFR